jgi:hypothetical protein
MIFMLCPLVAQQRDRTLDWSAVLGWLPTDTQTLVVARQPFVIPKHDPDAVVEPAPVDFLRRLVLGRLDEFPMLYQAIAGRTVKFALSSVSDFREFSGLGLVPYDGCAVIVFSEPLGGSLHSAIFGQPKEDWSGATIFSFSTEREGSLRSSPEQTNLFVTQLGSNVLIAATDRNSLHSLLERQAGSQTGRALPNVLPEWKEVGATAAVWAMRHYKRTYDRKTKLPVLSLGPLEELDDSEAVGVVYNAQPFGPAQKVYYLSHNQRATELSRRHWEWKEEGLTTPKVHRKADGVAEVTVPTPSADATASFALLLLASLGYTIAL